MLTGRLAAIARGAKLTTCLAAPAIGHELVRPLTPAFVEWMDRELEQLALERAMPGPPTVRGCAPNIRPRS